MEKVPNRIGLLSKASEKKSDFCVDQTDIPLPNSIKQRFCSNEAQIQCLFEFAPIGMLAIDPNSQRILHTNLAAQNMWGYEADEFLTKTITDLTFPDDLAESLTFDEKLANGQLDTHHFEKRYLRKDGSYFWGESCVTTLKDANSKTNLFIGNTIDITARKNAESEFLNFFNLTPDLACIASLTGYFLKINHRWSDKFGYSEQELLSRPYLDFVHPEDKEATINVMESLKTGKETIQFVNRYLCKDDSYLWLEWSATPEVERNLVFAIARNITQRKQAEAELRIAATTFDSQEGMVITDSRGDILRVNNAFSNITGYTAEEMVGHNPRMLSSGLNDAAFYAAMWKSIHETGKWEGDIWNRRKNNEPYLEHLIVSSIKYPDGTVSNYVGTLTDITISRKAAEEIQNLAFYDPLTQLPNRRLLQDRVVQALSSCERNGKNGAMLFIDLDNFKNINDTLGHAVGDKLLQDVAERLKSCVRAGDTVARIGGDEFVVMLDSLSAQASEAAAQTEAIGYKILAHLNQPYRLGKQELHNSPSIGIALFNSQHREIDEIYKQADIAMYQAKKAGRNTLRFFDPQMQEIVNARSSLENELRIAVECHQFFLHYQIQVDHLQHPFGAEALIRWVHPTRDIVSPTEFIPIAEETGMILPIGRWVLEMACAQLSAWQLDDQTRELMLSVNVSAKQFRQTDFAAQVKEIVQRHGINPAKLKLELTESILLDNIERIISTMNEISSMGVRFSLDDFGTGYSSLQYLKMLPLHQLKIDQSFVRDLTVDSSDRTIVNTIIAMAQSLNLEVIAEGVETEEQCEYLKNAGCTHYQGYLFGRPVPIGQFEALLANNSKGSNDANLIS
jgi:diguanylate cyclase (GGDEF)-like protein/PAS domain S-box-containing protein